MKNPITMLLFLAIIAISCGKQKVKKTQENQEVIELEEQIQEDQELIEQYETEAKELDAINSELESMLEEDE